MQERVAAYELNYRQSFQRWFSSLYLDKYHYIGDAELMNAAVLMDVGCYFIGPVKMVMDDHYKNLASLPYGGPVGAAFGQFMSCYNRRLAYLGRKRREQGNFGPKNVDHHFIFSDSFLPSYAVRKLIFRGMRAWLKAEVSVLWGRRKRQTRPQTALEITPLAPAS